MAGYGTDEGFAAFLEAMGYELPNDAPEPAVLRQRASTYLDGQYEPKFPGSRAGGYEQARAWPRSGAETVYGDAIPSDAVPNAIIEASCHAAYYEALNPGALSVAATIAGAVKREKVDSLEVEYFGGSGSVSEAATPVMNAVEGLLAPFLVATPLPQALIV